MKLPLRVVRKPQEQGFEYVFVKDSEDRVTEFFESFGGQGEDFERKIVELKAIVAAINGQAAQEEKIKGLLEENEGLKRAYDVFQADLRNLQDAAEEVIRKYGWQHALLAEGSPEMALMDYSGNTAETPHI